MSKLNLINRIVPSSPAVLPRRGFPAPVSAGICKISDLYGWSRSEIYRLLASGKLRAVKSGRTTLILTDSADQYLASLPLATFRTSGEVVS